MKSVEERVAERQLIPGSTWVSKEKTQRETRHVVDRTLGGDVIYKRGYNTRFSPQLKCTLTEWNLWVRRAKQREK